MFALNVSNFGFILFLCFEPFNSFADVVFIVSRRFARIFPLPCGVWKNTANLADYLSVSFGKPSKKGPVLFFVKGDRRIGGGGHIIFSGNRGGSVFVNRG